MPSKIPFCLDEARGASEFEDLFACLMELFIAAQENSFALRSSKKESYDQDDSPQSKCRSAEEGTKGT
jgi:hypothetical protein